MLKHITKYVVFPVVVVVGTGAPDNTVVPSVSYQVKFVPEAVKAVAVSPVQ